MHRGSAIRLLWEAMIRSASSARRNLQRDSEVKPFMKVICDFESRVIKSENAETNVILSTFFIIAGSSRVQLRRSTYSVGFRAATINPPPLKLVVVKLFLSIKLCTYDITCKDLVLYRLWARSDVVPCVDVAEMMIPSASTASSTAASTKCSLGRISGF